MPKKLLLLKRQEKKNQSQQESLNPQIPRSQTQNEALKSFGINLVSGIEPSKTTPSNIVKKISFYRGIVILISLLFSAVILINHLLDNRLGNVKSEQDRLSLEVRKYFQVEKDAKDLYERVSYYQRRQSQKEKFLDKTSFVFNNIGSSISIEKLDITKDKFTINAVGGNPADFTNLIYAYLNGNVVSEVSLKSANFSSRENVYKVEIEGYFLNE